MEKKKAMSVFLLFLSPSLFLHHLYLCCICETYSTVIPTMSTIMQKIKEIEDEDSEEQGHLASFWFVKVPWKLIFLHKKLSWAQKGEVFQTPKSKSFEIQVTCGTQTTKSFNEDNKLTHWMK
ncbi:uncharacterized protein LOC130512683 [Raphanus sativus]|uniref:Uncharacterized protein LOC130502075 n=1 Tax=Raphanus sativus TaxID=3726 RepID=A0A9W3DTH5_RAPSA|nr:uncharacterized protein LOC130502075 [Raphanus sativus]XP_056866883.1 uncharacterized protein LOC130512683 [Raphanus sativus]